MKTRKLLTIAERFKPQDLIDLMNQGNTMQMIAKMWGISYPSLYNFWCQQVRPYTRLVFEKK